MIERHEETFLAILAHHHGFKGVYVRPAGLVLLFHLDRLPAFFQRIRFPAACAARHRSGVSEDRRKLFRSFSDYGALSRRRYAHAAEGDDEGFEFGKDDFRVVPEFSFSL
jgi:hypothetical protein